MNKYSGAQVGSVMKLAAENLRSLSEENQELKSKVASFEKKERAEKIAGVMQAKSLEPETSFEEKVASLLKRDDISVVEEAVGLLAKQEKLASVSEDSRVAVEGGIDDEGGAATDAFASNLAAL
jgi:hypothetical protein